jgi:hypothetical protein
MNAGMGPFRVDVSFSSTGQSSDNGQGQFSQTWIDGGVWRWTASLGNVSIVRGSGPIGPSAESAEGVPMPIHLVRNAIFNPMYAPMAMGTQLSTAAAKVNGQPATCMMNLRCAGPSELSGPPLGRDRILFRSSLRPSRQFFHRGWHGSPPEILPNSCNLSALSPNTIVSR